MARQIVNGHDSGLARKMRAAEETVKKSMSQTCVVDSDDYGAYQSSVDAKQSPINTAIDYLYLRISCLESSIHALREESSSALVIPIPTPGCPSGTSNPLNSSPLYRRIADASESIRELESVIDDIRSRLEL